MKKILLTGATGYIGKRLLPVLVDSGYHVVCLVRDRNRFDPPDLLKNNIDVVEGDLLKKETLSAIPEDLIGAFYLVHSMSTSRDYQKLEKRSAINFREVMGSKVEHVVYLSGIVNDDQLSEHLSSRKTVEEELKKGKFHLTTLRAGIIIGSGSASFEIIRDLVEKLPVMITPKWLETRCQPIGISDVLKFLEGTILNQTTYDESYDIAGPDILSYKEMLLGFAKVRGLRRFIFTVPVMTPRLSSYWLYFVTSTSYRLAIALVDSMKVEVIAKPNQLASLLQIQPMDYETCLRRTFDRVTSEDIPSSWKDAMISGRLNMQISEFIEVPIHGCFVDKRSKKFRSREESLNRIWRIGGANGWYFGNWLWKIRGYLDKFFGGVGLRRGRTHPSIIQAGDALDFWRVLLAKKAEGRLLLFAEMRLPGEAWLEFLVDDEKITQTATFRPKGLLGRLYWYAVLPFHGLIFNGMLKELSR